MQFSIYSRPMIEHIQPYDEPHVIVSILTPGDSALPAGAKIKTNDKTLALLRLTFTDLDRHTEQGSILCDEKDLFQPAQARQILAVVKANPTARRVIVHCDAGLSRSPAVAAALSKILDGTDEDFFRRYHPNMLVYRTILDAHYATSH